MTKLSFTALFSTMPQLCMRPLTLSYMVYSSVSLSTLTPMYINVGRSSCHYFISRSV